MDKISVIIPCFNAEAYIKKCLDSVVNQTYGIDNLEVICINDASTDNTFEILCEYENRFPESFLIINNEVNSSQGYARNLGIQYSTSDYILFIDSDDYVDESIVEKLFCQMQKSDYDYVACRFYRVENGEALVIDDVAFENNDISPDTARVPYDCVIDSDDKRKSFILDEGSTLGCWATLYRKEFIINNDIRFAEGIVYEDLLWLGMIRFYAKHICIIPDRLYYYVNYNDTSIVVKNNSPHHFDRLKAMGLYLSTCRERGLDKSFKDEINWHFIWIYYVNSLILFARRLSFVPASILNDMVATIKREMPDYKSNTHVINCEGIAATIISIIEKAPLSQSVWNEILASIREI